MPGMKITLDAAMRARDVSRPSGRHEEAAQAEVGDGLPSPARDRAGEAPAQGPGRADVGRRGQGAQRAAVGEPGAAGQPGAGRSGSAGQPGAGQPGAGPGSAAEPGSPSPQAGPADDAGAPRRRNKRRRPRRR